MRVGQAERNAASFDAQRKTAILEKGKLHKQVSHSLHGVALCVCWHCICTCVGVGMGLGWGDLVRAKLIRIPFNFHVECLLCTRVGLEI